MACLWEGMTLFDVRDIGAQAAINEVRSLGERTSVERHDDLTSPDILFQSQGHGVNLVHLNTGS